MIKVARIIARLNVGGPARHVLLLANGLRAHGFETTVLTGAVDVGEEQLPEAGEPGFAIERIAGFGPQIAPLQDARALAGLVAALRRERPAIVHTHTAKAGALGRVAARIAGVPVVVHTFHGHVLEHYFTPTASALVRLAERGLTQITERLVTLSPRLKEELAHAHRVASPEQISVVPLGRDLAPFKHAPRGAVRRALGLGDDAQLVGAVGRLVPIKDLPLLLRAFARIALVRPQAHLVFVGDGVCRRELEEQARRARLESRVHLLGWRDDLPAVYADLDLVALSSKSEGTPLAIVEAFAAGRAVVATAVGGVPDMFGPAAEPLDLGPGVEVRAEGLLVPSGGNAEEPLAAALSHLLGDDALRRAMGARAQVSSHAWSAERLIEDVARLYRELLHQRGLNGTHPA